jgi:hypothetical protein
MRTLRTRRTYDHRIREMICQTGDPDLLPELKIPRSTIRNWFPGHPSSRDLQRAH